MDLNKNTLENKNGITYKIHATNGKDYLVSSPSGNILLAVSWSEKEKEWDYSHQLGEGNEALAIGMVMLVERSEHSENFASCIFDKLSYKEQFDSVMEIENAAYAHLTDDEKTHIYELYSDNDNFSGMVNPEIVNLIQQVKYDFSIDDISIEDTLNKEHEEGLER